jgi:hypothetical protein
MKDFFEPALCAFVDVLGFREKINQAYANGEQERLFVSLSEIFKACGARIREAEEHLPMLRIKFFSDNLILAYSTLPFFGSSLSHLCELLADYQLKMACNHGLFLRGAISAGTIGISDSLIFGDCLLKAHDLEKTAAKFPRIIVDPEIEKGLTANSAHLNTTWLLRDSDAQLFVNYLKALYQAKSTSRQMQTLVVNEDQLSSHGKQLERHLDEARQRPDIWFKYFWVANYHNHFCGANGQQQFQVPESLLLSKPTELATT